MALSYDVPFYPNPDNSHCFQAVFKMLLKYYQPDNDYNWEELDIITAKQPDKWTWPMAGFIWLHEHEYELVNVEDFDYSQLAALGSLYLEQKYGKAVANEQIDNSVISQEINWAERFAKEVETEVRLPGPEEVTSYLKAGYLVGANVNSRSLNNEPGYSGHFILFKGFGPDGLIAHDPGGSQTPGQANRKLSHKQFLKGWDYPDKSLEI